MGDTTRDGLVVGYDGSRHSGVAVDWAAAEASRRGTGLTVLYAADYVDVLAGPVLSSKSSLINWAGVVAEKVVRQGAMRAAESHPAVTARTVTRIGGPSRLLVDAARSASLVVVGSRGHGGFAGALLGSVAFSVASHASCPTVVVRDDGTTAAGPDHPVVVGIDGSPASLAALTFAAEAAVRAAAPLTVMTAWHTAATDGWTDAYWSTIDPETPPERAAHEAAAQIAHAAVAAVHDSHPGVAVDSRLVEGKPAKVLADASQGAGLLVVGARGRGGFSGLRLGSVSHGAIHGATCPVVIVHG